MRVFRIKHSIENDRPEIDYTVRYNRMNDWSLVDDVVRGIASTDQCPMIDVIVRHPGALSWDCYSCPGSTGLFSARATSVLRRASRDAFVFLHARLNAAPFYIPHCVRPLGCFDPDRSTGLRFEHDPRRFIEVHRYVFRNELLEDPLAFCVPDLWGQIFATASVVAELSSQGCQGIDSRLVAD